MTITEFIEARAAEREVAATVAPAEFDTTWLDVNYFREGAAAADYYESVPPARTLREVAATRAILAEHKPRGLFSATCPTCLDDDRDETNEAVTQACPCSTLRQLAMIDSGHPDYDPSWAPEQVSA